ncbi:MAG: ROK family protein [Proteobacteria bacterium]|nr:ROK family protein [Pseudomonadota bacterium]
MSLTLGIDLGGSAIKAGAVDTRTGTVVGELESVPTPRGATPQATRDALATLIDRFPQCHGPVGLAFPSVIKRGVAYTAANIDRSWIGTDAGALLAAAAGGRPGIVVNDADAAGVAEMRVGAGRGEPGVVMMLTFGTGIGTALFVDGRLWPNTELGHLEIDGREAEHRASAKVRTTENLDWPAWSERVNLVLARFHSLLCPDLYIVGGGVSERWEEFAGYLESPTPIRPATLRHTAGVVGAAFYATESVAR